MFTLLEQANTTSPLQSLAIATMDELSMFQATSTLIFIVSLSGLNQANWIQLLVDPIGRSRTFLNSAIDLDIFNKIPSNFGDTPLN